jgi:hypothetical protein
MLRLSRRDFRNAGISPVMTQSGRHGASPAPRTLARDRIGASRQGVQVNRAEPSSSRQIDDQELPSPLGQHQREDHSVGPGWPANTRAAGEGATPRDTLPAMTATRAAKPTMSITPITTTRILSARMRLVIVVRQKIPPQNPHPPSPEPVLGPRFARTRGGLVLPLPRCGRGASSQMRNSPSPAVRKREPSGARRVRAPLDQALASYAGLQ